MFWRERMVYEFDLLPEAGHRMPAFVNCQQYHLEQFLIERARRGRASSCASATG